MKFVFYHIVSFILLTVCFTGHSFGQIFNVNADTVVVTQDIKTDSIFVFYTSSTGTLKAKCRLPGPASFQWAKFDTITKVYTNIPLYTDSIAPNLASGGYQVHITAIGYDTICSAWVFIDRLNVKIEKDSQNNLYLKSYYCDRTDIQAILSQSNYIYYKPGGQKQTLPEPTYKWWSNDPGIPFYPSSDNTKWLRLNKSRLPFEKTRFYVEVKDRFGLISKYDSVNYTPIICKAIMDTTGSGSRPIVDKKNSAPFTAYFLNKSKNAISYTWYNAKVDSFSTTKMDKDSVTFYETGTFKVRLVAQSLQLCTDTAFMDIIVAPGQIEKGDSAAAADIKNVFTPNGDGKNDKFIIYNISIRQYKLKIYSRWGKIVHEEEGPNMLEMEGWDGYINHSSREASPGVYFYVLEVISWDKTGLSNKIKPKGQYSGVIYLFRDK